MSGKAAGGSSTALLGDGNDVGPASPPPAPTLSDVQSPEGLTSPGCESGMRMPAARLPLPCVHEAGHAVPAAVLNLPVLRATTAPNPERGNAGSVTYNDEPPPMPAPKMGPSHWPVLEDFMTAALAACCATARLRGEGPASQRGWDGDYEHARALAELRGVRPNEMPAYLNFICVRAAALVDALWPSIERVAEALHERETLTGEEVRALVTIEATPEERERERIGQAIAAIQARIPEPTERGDAADTTTAVV